MLFRPSCDRFKNDATRFAPGGACSQRACASFSIAPRWRKPKPEGIRLSGRDGASQQFDLTGQKESAPGDRQGAEGASPLR
jgi:hypothetical protein